MLPHRPLLRSAAFLRRRSASSIAIGVGPDVVTVDVTHDDWFTWVRALDGSRTLDEALREAPDADAGAILLRALSDAHCLDDAALAPRAWRTATVSGRDAIDRQRPGALTMHGSPEHVVALDRRTSTQVYVVGPQRIADLLAAHMRKSGLRVTRTEPTDGQGLVVHGTLDDPDALPERRWTMTHAELLVAVTGRRVSVGPLRIPGRTPCPHCDHLHRVDRDRDWPRIASQIAHSPNVDADDALMEIGCAWAAGTARTAVDLGVATMRGTDPVPDLAVCNQRLEMCFPTGEVWARRSQFHPRCGCRWADASAAVA
jgi:hypothetical protein